jgi:cold shock protein
MPTGTIKFYNRRKGFGFIKYDDSDKEIFVHATGMVDKKVIQDNDKVTFEEKEGQKGPSAVNVKKL